MDKLYRGIFWVKDIDSFTSVVMKTECNYNGFFTIAPDFELLAKSGTEFNHQAAWSTLSKRETDNKPYNYYPRGRVEIRNGKAVIYANGNIADEKLLKWAINEFNFPETSESLNSRNESIVQTELERYFYKAKEIILKNKEFLDTVVCALIEKETLLSSDIKKIREKYDAETA